MAFEKLKKAGHISMVGMSLPDSARLGRFPCSLIDGSFESCLWGHYGGVFLLEKQYKEI